MSYARCQYWHPGKPLLRSLSSSHIWKILEVYGIIWKHGIFCWKSIVQIHTSNNPLQLDPRCLTVTTKPCHPGTHVDCFLAKAWLFCNAIASKDCHGGVGTWCQSPFTGELLKVSLFSTCFLYHKKSQLQARWMNSLSNRLPHLT